jgi:3-oxoacyl-[acyl-carrier-protein] synthase-3
MYKNILVVGAEVHSKALDKTTRGRDVAVLFGDGAGAIILSASEKETSKIYSSHLHSEGKFAKELWVEAPGMGMEEDEFISHSLLERGAHFPSMNGKKVYVHAIKRMCESIIEGLEHNKMSIEDIDLFLFHQANLKINIAVAEKLGIPENKLFNTIQKYGNTTAATIPIGMFDALEAGILKRGMNVATSAFGSGFTWGSMFFKF